MPLSNNVRKVTSENYPTDVGREVAEQIYEKHRRIAESGTHEKFLAKGGKYAAMWNTEQKISA